MSTAKVVLGAGGVLLALVLTAGQVTTINTGENGLYTSFSGQVKNEILTPGIKYDGFGTIKVFNTRKITVQSNDLTPKTKDNTIMKDMDVVVTYSLSPTSLYDFYTGYDMSNHGVSENGQIELMASFIKRLITSAVNQSVDEYPALEVNSSLDKIQDTIKNNLNLALEKNNLAGKIQIESVVVVKADLPEDLVAAVNRVVTAQSAEQEQIVKNRTAELKANENKSIGSTITPEYLKYQQNEILREAMKNGSIQKILINGAPILSLSGETITTK
jgi:regulator of protease activity HflC (stomatin/prohibitin superfamily)